MSIKNLNRKEDVNLSKRTLMVSTDNSGWIRSPYWLTLPDISGEQAILLLSRIDNDNSNHFAFRCQGAYTVDWGDGTTNNYSTNVTAYHTYTYSSIPNTNEAELGYRQVIIKITPQAGQNLTEFNGEVATSPGSSTASASYLEAIINCSNMTALRFGGSRILYYLESVIISSINNLNMTSLNNMFASCRSLENIVMPANFPNVTNISAMFNNCTNLKKIPNFTTGTLTSTGATYAFNACMNISSVPRLDYSNCTSLLQTFAWCSCLTEIPPMGNTSSVTNWQSTFYECSALKRLPNVNTSNGTNFTQTCYGCYSIEECNFDTSKAFSLQNTFIYCHSLKKVPNFSIASITDGTTYIQNTFFQCYNLKEIPPLNFTNTATIGSNAFANTGLRSLTILNASNLTTIAANSINPNRNLSKFIASGLAASINIGNCYFSSQTLNDIYTNLASGVIGKTITVTGNYGVSDDDPTIATNKGWTVVG